MAEELSVNQHRLNDVESWELAKRFAGLFGVTPISFSVCVRTLMKDYQRDKQYGDISRFLAVRLMRGPTLSASMARAAAAWRNEYHTTPLPTEQYLEIFNPYDLAALIGYLYLFKRTKRICETDAVDTLVKAVIHRQHLCMNIGSSISNIGLGCSILVGGMHLVAFGAFLSHDEAGFLEYQKHLQENGVLYDLEYESQVWGCTSTQIASLLLQSFGYGLGIANAFMSAFSRHASIENQPNRIALGMRVCHVWLESLLSTGKIPNITHDGRYYPMPGPLERLLQVAALGSPEEDAFWLCAVPEQQLSQAAPTRRKRRQSSQEGDASDDTSMMAEPTIDVSIEELAQLTETIEDEIES